MEIHEPGGEESDGGGGPDMNNSSHLGPSAGEEHQDIQVWGR